MVRKAKVKKSKKKLKSKTGTSRTLKPRKLKSRKSSKSRTSKKNQRSQSKSKRVDPIPRGYHSVTPYLIVSNGEKAIEFYKTAFGAKLVFSMPHPSGRIGHAELKIGDSKIMLCDEYPEMGAFSPERYEGSAMSIHLYVKNVDNVIDRAVSAGAQLTRPVENMFYGDRSGGLKDPYGHNWYVSTHVEDVTPAKIKKRAQELFGNK